VDPILKLVVAVGNAQLGDKPAVPHSLHLDGLAFPARETPEQFNTACSPSKQPELDAPISHHRYHGLPPEPCSSTVSGPAISSLNASRTIDPYGPTIASTPDDQPD